MKYIFAFMTTGNAQNLQTYCHCHKTIRMSSVLLLFLLLMFVLYCQPYVIWKKYVQVCIVIGRATAITRSHMVKSKNWKCVLIKSCLGNVLTIGVLVFLVLSLSVFQRRLGDLPPGGQLSPCPTMCDESRSWSGDTSCQWALLLILPDNCQSPWEEISGVPPLFFPVVPILLVTYTYPSEVVLTFFNTGGEKLSG